jgi:hypothetical protein
MEIQRCFYRNRFSQTPDRTQSQIAFKLHRCALVGNATYETNRQGTYFDVRVTGRDYAPKILIANFR